MIASRYVVTNSYNIASSSLRATSPRAALGSSLLVTPLFGPKRFQLPIDAFQRGRITAPPARPHVVESLVEPADAGFTFLFAAGGKHC